MESGWTARVRAFVLPRRLQRHFPAPFASSDSRLISPPSRARTCAVRLSAGSPASTAKLGFHRTFSGISFRGVDPNLRGHPHAQHRPVAYSGRSTGSRRWVPVVVLEERECKSGISASDWLSASVAQVTASPLARRNLS